MTVQDAAMLLLYYLITSKSAREAIFPVKNQSGEVS